MTTIVALHAHPDDEVLMTGGTLARAAADGHRVVVVVATDGIIGPHTEQRLDELRASADVLGVRRVVHLGYADSGHGPILYPDPQDRTRFVRAPIDEAVYRLAGVLREENASVLLSYDENGGYGHRDHIRVHEVGRRAASSTKVRLLEATAPRELVGRLYQRNAVYSPRSAITHTFDVRRFAGQKQAALAAHQSVVSGDGRSAHVFRALVKIPAPLFGILLGREWFVAPR